MSRKQCRQSECAGLPVHEADPSPSESKSGSGSGSESQVDPSAALGVWMVIPWLNHAPGVAYWIFVLAGFGSTLVLEIYPWQTLPTGLEHVGAVVGLMALVQALATRRREKGEVESLRNVHEVDDPVAIATIATQCYRVQRWSWRHGFQPTYHAIADPFTARGWTVPRNIIDQNCAETIGSIPLTEVFLEPETARACATMSSFVNWIIVSGGLSWMILGSWITSGWWRVGVGVTGFLVLVYGWIFLQQALTGRSSVNYGTIGLGVIELGDGRLLRADECITLVRQSTHLHVRLLASRGATVELVFASVQDPGFLHFWIRWNHPHPRPELME